MIRRCLARALGRLLGAAQDALDAAATRLGELACPRPPPLAPPEEWVDTWESEGNQRRTNAPGGDA